MAKAKVFNGARALVYVDNILVGLFDNCSYSTNIGAEAIHTLGKFGAQEITPTSYEAVTVNCSGFRIIGNGGHVLPKFPKLQDLLNLEYITLSMIDRQAAAGSSPIMTVQGCVPISYSTGAAAKGTSRISVTYMGVSAEDESSIGQAEAGAATLP